MSKSQVPWNGQKNLFFKAFRIVIGLSIFYDYYRLKEGYFFYASHTHTIMGFSWSIKGQTQAPKRAYVHRAWNSTTCGCHRLLAVIKINVSWMAGHYAVLSVAFHHTIVGIWISNHACRQLYKFKSSIVPLLTICYTWSPPQSGIAAVEVRYIAVK